MKKQKLININNNRVFIGLYTAYFYQVPQDGN